MWVEVLVNQGGCEVGSELGNVLCICSVESMEVEDASEVDVKLEVRFYHVFPMVKHVVVGSFGLDHIKSDVVSPDLLVRAGGDIGVKWVLFWAPGRPNLADNWGIGWDPRVGYGTRILVQLAKGGLFGLLFFGLSGRPWSLKVLDFFV
ncbi:hypothetical protein U1Q18_009821 [Sarracenia purpurea var. burkii]